MDPGAPKAGAVQSRFVLTRLGRLHFRLAGEGPAIVLLHINRQSSALYLELIEAMRETFCVLAPDLPGYGLSDHPDSAPSIGDYAECVRTLLASRGIDKAIILGEAVGAAVAAAFAANYPQATRAVVLLNCPSISDRHEVAALVASARTHAANDANLIDDDTFVARHGQTAPLNPSPSWIARVRQAHQQCGADCWQAADALLAFNLRDALRTVVAPTLVLTGERSPFAGFQPEVVATLPNARSQIIAGGRFGLGWEKAEEVARLAAEFTAEEARPPACVTATRQVEEPSCHRP